MTSRIPQLRPHLRQQNLQLIQTPPRIMRKQPQTKSLNALEHRTQLQQARIPQPLFARPRPNRKFEFMHLDVDEAHALQAGNEQGGGSAQYDAGFARCDALLCAPCCEGGSRDARGGLDYAHVVHFLQLDVAAGFGVSVASNVRV